MLTDLLDPGSGQPAALARPKAMLTFGSGGGTGGGLLDAAASALGVGGNTPGLESALVRLNIRRSVAPGVDWAEMILAQPPGGHAPPAVGDEGTIELEAEDGKAKFSCIIDLVETRPDGLIRLTASNGGRILARRHADLSFADRSPGQIIDALAGEAGIQSSAGDAGEKLPRYVVDRRRSLLDHASRLASTAGKLAFFDDAGALVLFDDGTTGEPAGKLVVGANVLDLRIVKRPGENRTVVLGEGAPDQGRTAWAWLRKNGESAQAQAGEGDAPCMVAAPWAASRAAATALADAHARAMTRETSYGRFIVSALPQAVPGATIELSESDAHDGMWLVLEVDQHFDLAAGLVSEVRAVPIGGAGSGLPSLGDLL